MQKSNDLPELLNSNSTEWSKFLGGAFWIATKGDEEDLAEALVMLVSLSRNAEDKFTGHTLHVEDALRIARDILASRI